ncbi:MAG: S8/S53 family peptidase [Candidatus Zixiibacteriota bacterium]
MSRYRFILYLLLLGFSTISVSAGNLSDELTDLIAAKKSSDIVKVWIKLYDVETSAEFKAKISSRSSALSDIHKSGIDRLKANHTDAQDELLDHLRAMTSNKQASVKSYKGHWIANIIEAEVSVEQLRQLERRSDIETIYSEPQIVSILPEQAVSISAKTAIVESNIQYINAPAAWSAGYTGQGRVVCSFDTGVDGLHPALFNNWKGHDGDSAAAWFDPASGESFPHSLDTLVVPLASPGHGTHTMGIIVGHDDATGDTIGVALDAKWISAGVIDIYGASIIDAFEWAADPDGDPNSIDDVPDVISHSWGVSDVGCDNIFFTIIDNVEALGIVNVFSAGNEGLQGAGTIRNPAVRANTNIDCFAVGNIDDSVGVIAQSSSLGPSSCNGATKPNVVAPGVGIRSAWPGGGYSELGGTSQAAPHVAGLVAMLRQRNPNATVDEIKQAILVSTNKLGRNLPDNTYGWGLIDCMAALNALSETNATPNIRVYSFDHDPISPGDEVVGTLVLQNLGAPATGVTATLVDHNPSLDIIAGLASFGAITTNEAATADVDFRVMVSDTVTEGSLLSLELNIDGDGYSTTTRLYFQIGPVSQRNFVTHDVGNIDFTISNWGTFGLGSDSYYPAGGVGFRYMGGSDEIFDGGLMIGVASDKVSDGVRNASSEPDGDFAVLPGGEMRFITPDDSITQQSWAVFTDARAENPIGLTIEQTSYAFNYEPYRDFIIIRYIIQNTGTAGLGNVYVGLNFDWDVIDWLYNAGGYSSAGEFTWVAYHSGTLFTQYRGVKLLHGLMNTAFTSPTDFAYCVPDSRGLPVDCYTSARKFAALTKGIASPVELETASDDLLQLLAARIPGMSVGETDTVAFALIAASTFTGIETVAERAYHAYVEFLHDGIPPEPPTPKTFALRQNYPNPFNSGTTILFNLPEYSNYTLTVYNVLGQKVREYKNADGPGEVMVTFDGGSLASGVYLYKLDAGNNTESKKMLLLK